MQKKNQIQTMCVCAVLVALSTALSFVKVWQMPLGGSVTLLSMLPVAMISVMYGLKWGMASAFVYSLTQFAAGIFVGGLFTWGLTPIALIGTILLDYILPFTFLGISGIFRKKGYIGVCIGVAIAVAIRFVCHFLSGVIIFGTLVEWDSWIYSLTYNGSYMLPELILTVVGATALFSSKQIKKLIGI